ncbi:MAG: antitoxin Xre/MbcA/ParS toxin-binding domain-containing protein [Sulfuricellaceae bacterium]
MQCEKTLIVKAAQQADTSGEALPGNFVARQGIVGGYCVNIAGLESRDQRLSREHARFCGLLAHDGTLGEMAVVNLVQDGLPVNVIEIFIKAGITQQEVYELVAPRRTLTHRRAKSEPLSPGESDRAVRLARVLAQAESVFDSKEKAMNWLRCPMKRFDGRAPLRMLETDVGSRLVEEALVQIDEGFFA